MRLLALRRDRRRYEAVTIGRAAPSAHHHARLTVARLPALDPAEAAGAARGAGRPLRPRDARAAADRRAARRPRTPPAGTRAPSGSPTASRRRTATPSTSWSTAGVPVRVAAGRRARAPDELWDAGRADPLRPVRAAALERAAGARGGGRPVSPSAFDICGPLPTGITVLEASAGTGKTYTIAALAARYVAEGMPLDQLLLVTFTRMATGELRDRVRERLVSAERALAERRRPSGDAVVAAARRRVAGGGRARGAAGWCARWRTSTRRRSPPPTGSARRCSAGSAWPATWSRTPSWSRTSATCSARWSTTSTSAAT